MTPRWCILARRWNLGRIRLSGAGLQYFTHVVDERLYGAWYRILSPTQMEVLGVGMLEVVSFAGAEPNAVASAVLENFVRHRIDAGIPLPSLSLAPLNAAKIISSARDVVPASDEELVKLPTK